MKLTVERALKIEGMNKCTLVAGKNGVQREIAFLDNMEVPDIAPWLKEKELLVTTGYSLYKDQGKLLELIEALHQSGASGLVIKTRFLGGISEQAIALADAYSLPLITIPDEMPSMELCMPLFRAILDVQNERLRFSSSIHNKFTALELSGGGLEEVADMLHRLLSMPVIIADKGFKISASVPDGTTMRTLYQQITPDLRRWAEAEDCGEDAAQFACGGQQVVVRKARFKEQVCSYILVVCPEGEFDDMHRVALDHAATTAALEFSKLDALSQRLSLMDNNFFIDIIMRNVKSEEEARQRAQYLGWQAPPFSLVVYDISHFEASARNRSELELLALKQQVAEEIRQSMLHRRIPCTIVSKSDSFSCLCAALDAPQLTQAAQATVRRVHERLKIQLTAGISGQVGSYTDIWAAHAEANDALTIGRKTGAGVVFAGEVKLERAVLHAENKDDFRALVESTVERLYRHDAKHRTEFVPTLQALVANMGVRSKTAQALFLHRNTLLLRIQRMEEITGCDLSRSETLLEMGMALRVRPML